VEPTLFADQPKEEIDLIDRMIDLIDDVPHLRHTAKDRVTHAQAKLAQSYQVRRPYQFQIGEKVLYYDKARAAQHHMKLAPKWKGPYTITAVLSKGAYRIADENGDLRASVNGDLLKKYYSRESWEPIVLV
jgi:hypothetical protein